MATIENSTGVPHFWFEQTGPDGEHLDVLVVRATFAFGVNGQPMTVTHNQQPIAYGDAYSDSVESDPLRAVITEDGDLLPYKPGTDVLIVGHAVAPTGIAQPSWLASVRVGQMRKTLRLHGPRNFYKTFFGWRLGPSEPVAYVPLDYRLAYGGCIDVPAALTAESIAYTIKHPGNPAGCGWLPKPSAYKHLPRAARRHIKDWIKGKKVLPAPQIESEATPVRYPFQNVDAQGFSTIARWCEPRLSWQGTYDDEWHATRNPMLPKDFDSRYYQSAAADQVCSPYLIGDERVVLTGLLSDDREMCLPGWRMVAAVTRASGESTLCIFNLDTVRFDLDSGEASLVWRAHFDFVDPVVEIALAAITGGLMSDSPSMTAMPNGENTR